LFWRSRSRVSGFGLELAGRAVDEHHPHGFGELVDDKRKGRGGGSDFALDEENLAVESFGINDGQEGEAWASGIGELGATGAGGEVGGCAGHEGEVCAFSVVFEGEFEERRARSVDGDARDEIFAGCADGASNGDHDESLPFEE
jgi:hypothetical protein